MSSGLLMRIALRLNARQFVEALYRALLGRNADAQGLAAYSAELERDGDVAGVARSIAGSEEAWRRALMENSPAIVTAAFRGLLGRDPEPEALAAYTGGFADQGNPAALIDDIGRSNEHWQRLLRLHADDVVRAIFLALLQREPEPQALQALSSELRSNGDLAGLVSTVAANPEHWELLLQQRRDSRNLLRSDDLASLLGSVTSSPRVWNELAALRFPLSTADEVYNQESWVFVHAQKTGGTSLQNMLAETFGEVSVYHEHGDTLFRRSPAELAQYSIFAGHFNFDSIDYIPRRARRVFTFLREPRQRLLSLYRFLRAHEPESPSFRGIKEIANRLEAVEFFQSVMAQARNDLWNHLTWCVMGQRNWSRYRHVLSDATDGTLPQLLDSIRQEIRTRLQEFAFVGLQEDYTHSCERLFALIGSSVPHVRRDHTVESLVASSHYFKSVPRRPLIPQLHQAMAPLVQLDDIVYQEGVEQYRRRWARVGDGEGYGSA